MEISLVFIFLMKEEQRQNTSKRNNVYYKTTSQALYDLFTQKQSLSFSLILILKKTYKGDNCILNPSYN